MKCKGCAHSLIKVPVKFKWVHRSSGGDNCEVIWCKCKKVVIIGEDKNDGKK